jgi:3-hydroxyacyl-CoA dehydrogenase
MIDYHVADEICVLRLNSPPLNTITLALLDALRAAVRRGNQEPGVRAMLIIGDADHFSAGADINLLRDACSAEEAVRTSRVFQEAFQELEDSPKPLAAAVAGRVMGSALELALACHVRIAAKGSTLAMPEVNLGINPGAGGTQRLPRLIGAEAALQMLLSGEPIGAEQAQALGLVDALCDGNELQRCARNMLRAAAAPRRTSRLTDKVQDAAVNQSVFRAAEASLAKVRPELIAPRKIVEAVKVGLEQSAAAGLRAEQEAFAACMATPATRNKMYLFFATRQAAKPPGVAEAEPAAIRQAAVVGMGTMGAGITQALASAGVPVVVLDQQEAIVERGMERISGSLRRRVEQGRLSPERAAETLRLISPASQWSELSAAEVVIEAVFEDVATKRAVIACIENACAADAIIATNTSTISLDVLGEGMRRPERLIGMHFFHPAYRMPLVEIVRRRATPGSVIAAALQLAKRLRKTPVLVGNREGFLVNRLFIPYLKEAFWLLEEGAEAAAIDAAMIEFGFPMGPLALSDMAGLDVLVSTDKVMSRAFPRHGGLSPVAVRLVERGHLGQKAAAGVYKYQPGQYTPNWHEVTGQIVAEAQRESGRAPRKISQDEILQRLVLRMVCEAFYVLAEALALRASDVDVAMVLGTGFPDFRGGVLKYAEDLGLASVLADLERLAARFGQRFSPCPLLREMVQ